MIRALLLAAVLLAGCADKGNRATGAAKKVDSNAAVLAEKSRELNKGASDALDLAPTNNPPTELAQKFLEKNQQIVGLPLVPYDVIGILTGIKGAGEKLDKRFDALAVSLADRQKLEIKLDAANAELQDLGRKYETQHKQNVVKRVWRWSIATFGVGGVIALMFFFPVLIPLFTRFVGWVVSMFPKLAGWVGVISVKSFDSVTKGIQLGKKKIDANKNVKTAPEPTVVLGEELYSATDKKTKDLVDARKEVLAADGEIPPIAKVIGPPTPKLEAAKPEPVRKMSVAPTPPQKTKAAGR